MDEPARYHVMRHADAKVIGERIGRDRSSVDCSIDDRNVLPDFRIVDAEGDGV